ncbi:MAG: hypothetical protein M0030_05275 [Actinomycetota bacterium]|nr:hypothetical protein [Actinomycetota bacterium]
MSVRTEPRHRRAATPSSGGADGNEKLTAMTGAVLLILLAALGVTILAKRQLITQHFFLGFLLLGPVTVKLGSTMYRFVRYYTGSAPYVRKGPPAPLLRLLGPAVILTSLGVFGSGVALAFVGPGNSIWLLAHKGFFVLWFGAMSIHVLAYAPRLPRLLSNRAAGRDRMYAVLAGAGRRWMLLTASLIVGLVLALATYHLGSQWTSFLAHHG